MKTWDCHSATHSGCGPPVGERWAPMAMVPGIPAALCAPAPFPTSPGAWAQPPLRGAMSNPAADGTAFPLQAVQKSIPKPKPWPEPWTFHEWGQRRGPRPCHCLISDGCSVHYCYLDKNNSSHQWKWKSIIQLSFTCSSGNRHSILIHCWEPASKRAVRGPQMRMLSAASQEEKQMPVWTGLLLVETNILQHFNPCLITPATEVIARKQWEVNNTKSSTAENFGH